MRWLWRLVVLILLLLILQNSINRNDDKVFIHWSPPQNIVINLEEKVRYLQKLVQDLPANIEVEIWKILDEAKPKGNAKAI